MSELARFSVSLEADLLRAFDQYVRAGAFATRSEAIRQLLLDSLTRKSFATDQAPVLATLTLVYEHHRPHLVERLLTLQHEHCEQVIASLHVHMDEDRCLEVLVLRGRGRDLVRLAESLRGLKGVHRGELTLAETAQPPTEVAGAASSVEQAPTHPHPPPASTHSHPHPHPHRPHSSTRTPRVRPGERRNSRH
jgi:CopG family nickel-responsive transcriptional regulator